MQFELEDDLDTACNDSDSFLKDTTLPCEPASAAAEQRRVSLALAINAGFPGPSGLIRS